jgi:hypothetical protein
MMPRGPVEVLRMGRHDQTVVPDVNHPDQSVILHMRRRESMQVFRTMTHSNSEMIHAGFGRHPDVVLADRRSQVELAPVSLELARLLSLQVSCVWLGNLVVACA